MNHSALSRAVVVISAVALIHLPATAGACAACMGDVNSKTAPAINAAIFLMLGCIGLMLSSLAGFAFYLFRRAGASLPPQSESPIDHSQEDNS